MSALDVVYLILIIAAAVAALGFVFKLRAADVNWLAFGLLVLAVLAFLQLGDRLWW